MISHRASGIARVALCLAGLTLAACDRAGDITPPSVRAGSATLSGNAAKNGAISARVLTNKSGVSILEVRTGTFDNTTNTGTPDGWFEKIKYTVILQDGSKNGKKIFERNVNFNKAQPNFFSEVINVCKKGDEDDPPKDPDKKPHTPCTLQVDKSYVIAIEANLKGVGLDGKKTDVVRDSADFFNGPEIDLSGEKVQLVITTDPRVTTDILAATVDSTTTYQARFVNSSPDVGVLTTCEVHVFNSANLDVTPAGLTYRWIPNARPAYDATKPGSAASDTTTIKPGEQAICEFRMKLAPTGSYRITVTANAVYPDDYDPSNNTATGTVTVITGTPVLPPPNGGFGANAVASDYEFYGAYSTNPLRFFDFRGDSAQRGLIDSLSSTLLVDNGSGLTGSFTLKLHLFTVDSIAPVPATSTRNLADATWTGDLAALVSAANLSGNPCVSSSQTGTLSVPFAANQNAPTLIICIVPAPPPAVNTYRINVSVRWLPKVQPPPMITASNGGVPYGDYLFFHTDLSFSAFSENPVSHVPIHLTDDDAALLITPNPLGAVIVVHRTH